MTSDKGYEMNNVNLTGRLTKDPELRTSSSGSAYMKFIMAVNRRFKKEGQPDVDFINCTAFGKTAETMANHLHKGSLIGVSGEIQTGSYTDKDGKKVYTTEIMVNNFDFLEKKDPNQQSTQQSTQQSYGGYSSQSYGGYGQRAQSCSQPNYSYQSNSYTQPVRQAPNSYVSPNAGQTQPAQHQPQPYQHYTSPTQVYQQNGGFDGNSIFTDGDDLNLSGDDLPF